MTELSNQSIEGLAVFRTAIPLLVLCLLPFIGCSAYGQMRDAEDQAANERNNALSQKETVGQIDRLIAQLGNKSFQERETASKALGDIGLPALEALRKAASTAKDAEVCKRARELVQALEQKHEIELAFAWFDSLGFPDFANCKFVRIATGRVLPYEAGGRPKNCYYLAFLVHDDGTRFKVFEVSLDTRIYAKTEPDKPEHERVGYESWDLKKEMVELLMSLDQPEDKDGFPRRPWERLGEPAELFVWARACAAQSEPKLADRLFAQAKKSAEKLKYRANNSSTFRQIIADEIAHTQMWQAVETFGDPAVSRRDLLTRFARIVEHFPQSPHWNEAQKTVGLLKKMVTEDKAHASKSTKAAKEMSKEERIADLIFRLRDQNGQQMIQPGSCDIFVQDRLNPRGEKSPAQQLLDIGYDAVPQLIEALEDDRFTRSVEFHRNFRFSHSVLRVGDCAEIVLGCIAGRVFWEGRAKPGALLKDGPITDVKKSIQEWWDEFMKKRKTGVDRES